MTPIALADSLPRPIAYVLAGGASYGAVQVGHLRALANTDITPELVVGTSVGSLNGAVLAEDPAAAPARLTELWENISREEVFGRVISTAMNLATRKPAATDNSGLTEVIHRALTARTFEELALPHVAMATDFETGQGVALTRGDLTSALLASAAIPLVFPPIERGGRTLVDGGLVANVPIAEAAARGAQTLIVLDCGFTVIAPRREDTVAGRLLRTAAIMAAQQVRRDLDRVADRTVLYLPGPWPIGSRPDSFAKSTELAAATYAKSMAWLHGVRPDGPGRYGTAPSDSLTKRPPAVRPPDQPADGEVMAVEHGGQDVVDEV